MKLLTLVLFTLAAFATAHHPEHVPSLKKNCHCDPVICPAQLMSAKSVSSDHTLEHGRKDAKLTSMCLRFVNVRTLLQTLATRRLRADALLQRRMYLNLVFPSDSPY
jgi:hypothetical protein